MITCISGADCTSLQDAKRRGRNKSARVIGELLMIGEEAPGGVGDAVLRVEADGLAKVLYRLVIITQT